MKIEKSINPFAPGEMCPGDGHLADIVNSPNNDKELCFLGMKQIDPGGYRKAYRLLKKGADYGDARCQYDFALLLLNGNAFRKDYKRAIPLLEQSSQNGNPDADYKLGLLYYDGKGMKRDVGKGRELILNAFEKGSELAQ